MRTSASVFAVVLLALLGSGCGRRDANVPASESPSARPALRKAILQTDWFPQAEHGGYYQAMVRGFYADAGLDVEIWPGGPGAGIKLKVARGDADFGMDRSDNLILVASGGLPLVMVAATMQHDPQALMVHADSPVKTFRDLDGRGVIGNVGMTWFKYLENKYGITIERRQNTYGLGEFLANTNVIQQCVVTNEPFFARQNGREVRTLLLSEAGYDCYQALFTRRELIRTSPEMVRAFVQASIRGWRDYLEGDATAADAVMMKRNPEMTPALLAFSRNEMLRHKFVQGDLSKGEDVGQISVVRIAEQIETMRTLGLLKASVTVASVASTEFLPVPHTAGASSAR
ncbi:ABC transporter substrate-binding protein [Horticoccus sp. 23ND18S-11]|uniref:ABC transporter substrate-binding protein n=1 Tax=Horticoccus sp. 23ND18S-11 TaxID=3391832 RepID=UPI0039C92A23